MGTKAWDALRPCKRKLLERKPRKRKVKKARDNLVDRLSCLPDDILLDITSRLPIKEAAKTSVLSHRWRHLWRYYPHLNFEDPRAYTVLWNMENKVIDLLRSNFVSWVNGIVDRHLGQSINEFRVAFYLNTKHQFEIDKWLGFAFSKQVKVLELNLSHKVILRTPLEVAEYKLELQRCIPNLPLNLANIKPALTTLSLKCVDVTTEVVECFFDSFPFLENLCITTAPNLTYIKACLQIPLKHLRVSLCPKLNGIDLPAPKLLSFNYGGKPVELHIRNSSSLSHLVVGNNRDSGLMTFAFDGFLSYFQQLSYLELRVNLNNMLNKGVNHLGISRFPKLMNLKHLVLSFSSKDVPSVLGWTPLIEACPVLQKLTFEFKFCQKSLPRRMTVKHKKRPLECLKTLEILGSVGHAIDVEMAEYVVQNAPVLKEVIVVDEPFYQGRVAPTREVLDRAKNIEHMLPQGVEFICK